MSMAGEVVMNRPLEISTGGETCSYPSSSSQANGHRISFAVDQLLSHIRGDLKNIKDFCRLCISLSRGIDYAVAHNEIADRASELPNLLKQVCQWQNGAFVLAATMMLMISIKGACRNGWFSERDSDELRNLWNKIASSFCSVSDMNSEESTLHHSISAIMSRFYPGMKMGEILAFVEATPGYGAIVKDFHIPKVAKDDAIYLFVAQTDNTETSSCIVSPQQVNFLVNGTAVDRRTCLYKDPGPQIPTLVKHMVKYGTNLLQAVGHFSGKYIIVIAFMSIVSNPSFPTLPDYMRPVAAASDTDNDIIEGLSRVSLNCPISFKRIKTPVKGHLCNHLQCFDFDNYVDINSRRPSWRCPHCSQSVCFTDIRIDQGMVKVLKEVGVDVSHVKICADGLWETVNEGGDHTHKSRDKPSSHEESTISLDVGGDILDLTETDYDMDSGNCPQENDRKPSVAQLQDVNMNNAHRSIASHMENQSWRTDLPSPANRTSNSISNVTMGAPANAISLGLSPPYASNNMQLPTYAIGSSNTRSNVTVMPPITGTVMNTILQSQSQTFTSNDMQSQQHNSNNMSNGNVRYLTPGRQVTRITTPAQASQGTGGGGRQQQYSGSQMDQHQITPTMSAMLSQNMSSQVLKEVGVDVSHVKICADGLWETVNEGGDHTHKSRDKPSSHEESTISLDVGGDILDLTETDYDMDSGNCPQENDRKPSVAQLQDVNMNNAHRSIASHMENQSWRTDLPSPANRTSNSISNVTMGAPANAISLGLSPPYASNNMQLPTYAIGSSNTRSNVTVMPPITGTVMNTILQSQSQTFTSNDMQSQQHNSNNMSNGNVRYLTPGRQVTRITTPAQASQGTGGGGRQQQYSGSQMDQHQITPTMSAMLSQNMSSQSWVHHEGSHVSSQPVQQFAARTALPQLPNGYQHTSPHPADQFYSQQNQPFDQMLGNSMWSTTQLSQNHQRVEGFTTGLGSYQQAQHYTMGAAQRAIQISSTPPVPTPLHTSGSFMPQRSMQEHRGQAQLVNNFSANAPVDTRWRPTRLMRGGLSGQAYSDAVNQMICHPTQLVQPARPQALNTPRPVLPPHLQVLIGNNRNAHDYQDQLGASGGVRLQQ